VAHALHPFPFMQRVLVAGGAGLVGSHLVDRLLAEGNEVIAVDDLSRGSFANLAHLKREPRFAFLEHDIASPFRAKVDRIFHLAVPSTRAACEADHARAILTCVGGTLHVLEVAVANGAPVVVAGSTERWGEGGRCAESLGIDYARSGRADVRLVRLPRAYGPRMAPDGDDLVTSLVLQALRGEDLSTSVHLDRRVRLGYAADAVETLVRAMNGEARSPVVVAPSSEAMVIDIAYMIAEAAGLVGVSVTDGSLDAPPSSSVPTSGRPPLQGVPQTSVPLAPSIELAEGLARTVAWFEARLGRRHDDRPSGSYGHEARASGVLESAPASLRAG
jgi:UDP-glucuronate decarboxylase